MYVYKRGRSLSTDVMLKRVSISVKDIYRAESVMKGKRQRSEERKFGVIYIVNGLRRQFRCVVCGVGATSIASPIRNVAGRNTVCLVADASTVKCPI
ncbi:hypothetical protein EVAR_86574_1 [Eumeta japonica]|uniref:Uncharacterized protein n=1 Tax=Eumeta variegata TaxID=151549 RepID=A0A4C1W1Q6_EUMVA|nr:hypothetical protein EVAR_86574_1 [Eumeta japonica]